MKIGGGTALPTGDSSPLTDLGAVWRPGHSALWCGFGKEGGDFVFLNYSSIFKNKKFS